MTCFFMACDAVKRVEATDYLLTENSFFINGQKKKSEELTNLSFQKKNVITAWNSLYDYIFII